MILTEYKNEKWDLIIFVLPTGSYVDDGFRDMTMADADIRNAFTEHLKELVVKNHPQTQLTYIGGDYAENYAKAIQLIDGIYQEY